MGWDADSSANYIFETKRFEDPKHEIFAEVSQEVSALAGTVDGYLHQGGLDCFASCEMLQEATGESCYNHEGWSAEKVKQLNESADWRIHYTKKNAWAYWSARKFLETCAALNLSISFSW